MKNFQHPFNDTLLEVNKRLDILLKKLDSKYENPKYVILDNADILKIFKISDRTAANWRKDGTLSYAAIKGKVYYRLSDVHKLLDDNTTSKKKE